MSVEKLRAALEKARVDESVAREMLLAWPLVASILEAFSRATALPIFVQASGELVFVSPAETMPAFCSLMLGNHKTADQCREDAHKRAAREEPDTGDRLQLCHAGLLNGWRTIDTGCIGTMTIFFGARLTNSEQAVERRERLIGSVASYDKDLGASLRAAAEANTRPSVISSADSELMDIVANVIQRMLSTTVVARSLAINMSHELSLMLLSMGFLAQEIEGLASDISSHDPASELTKELSMSSRQLMAESGLGLYVVRNFLSSSSETRYREVIKPRFSPVELGRTLEEMIDLYSKQAAKKEVTFEATGLENLPQIDGVEMEIRRLFHNLLNNAVKYSYHSAAGTRRTIRVRAKVPYDPGFRERRFSIVIENYGLGLSTEERRFAFNPGFRGWQATTEVPMGAGIGLSEAMKIVKIHNGEIRIHSEKVHEGTPGNPTYKTIVEVILPYKTGHDHHKRTMPR